VLHYIYVCVCVCVWCKHSSWAEPAKFSDCKKKISQVFYFPNGYYEYNTILRFTKYIPPWFLSYIHIIC